MRKQASYERRTIRSEFVHCGSLGLDERRARSAVSAIAGKTGKERGVGAAPTGDPKQLDALTLSEGCAALSA